ncbi:MAG TPA: HDIG domain-containing protein, partial [Spirochaetia bacterium]|nr:HDIG domain-containing protein [Spirochaetia bacterium]
GSGIGRVSFDQNRRAFAYLDRTGDAPSIDRVAECIAQSMPWFGIETDSDQNHAEVGMELARKLGEDPRVINAIGSHHADVEPSCPESVIVQMADAISAARPGARRETLDNYIKRLENLENIAESFSGVDKAYAIQAGRELRILVNNEQVSDDDAKDLCKSIAKKIETDLRYPGRIKVTIIRETRIVEYAR